MQHHANNPKISSFSVAVNTSDNLPITNYAIFRASQDIQGVSEKSDDGSLNIINNRAMTTY